MRIVRYLGSVCVLAMLLCCSVALGQAAPATAVPFISQVTPPSIAPPPNPSLIVQFTLTILGANFPPNAIVKLTLPQGPSIYAASASVNAAGSQIVAQFNTSLPRPAVYTVTVANAVNNPTAVSNVFYLPVTPPATTVEISQNSSQFLTGYPSAMATGDFNGDGNVDVAFVSQNTNTVSILLGTFGGTLSSGAAYPTGNLPSGIVAADFNGDGVLDLAVTNSADNTITILLGNGDGTFRSGTTINDTGTYPTQIVAADFNGDGHLDLAVLNFCGPTIVSCAPQTGGRFPSALLVLLGNGDGTFSASPSSPATGASSSAMAAADLNSDGAIDLVVANQNDTTMTVLMGNGDGTFTPTQSGIVTGVGSSAIAIADFNGDGKLDIAVANVYNNAVSIFLNQNCGLPAVTCTFSATPMSVAVGTNPYAISAGDMNADGFVDLVVANLGGNSISVLLGDGTGGFTPVYPLQSSTFGTGGDPIALTLADFSGDGRLDVATANWSGSYTILTQKAVPQVVLTTGNNSPAYGMNITFTANVIASIGIQPTGTVSLYDGPSWLATVALSGYQANFFISTLTAGTHQIIAVYNGDSNFLGGSSPAVTETVSQATTTLTLTSNVNTLPYGQPFTLSATVVISNLGSPTGTVSFFDTSTATSLGTAPVTSGVAQLTLSTLLPGAHAITALYEGDTNFLGSSSPTYTENITQASTTISVSTSQSPINLGQTATFTAAVQPSASAAATGTISFYDNGSNLVGTVPIVGTTNSASLVSPVLALGGHAITAHYSGDSNYTGSTTSSFVLEQVNPSASVVNLSTTTTTYGQAAVFTATVQGVTYSGIPTGSITVSNGSTILGISPLVNGTAIFTTTSPMNVGPNLITASYSGDSNFQTATSAPVAAYVLRANSSVSVSPQQNPSYFNQPIYFIATVQPAYGGSATGTVTFFDGSATLGTGPLSNNMAVLSLSSLTVGTHSITASFGGDNNVNGSGSAVLTQTVNPTPTTITVTSNANPSTYGQTITLAASVKATYGTGNAPASTVSFYDGITLLGSVNTASPQITIFTLTAGAHSLSAQYAGNSNYASSTSSVLTQTVNQAGTTTTVTSNLNPSAFGQSVTLGATVNSTYNFSSNGGTVTFYDNGVSIGSAVIEGNGVSLPTSTLATGSHSMTASYGGDSNLGPSTSAVFTQTVNQAPVSPTIVLSSYNTTYGQPITMTSTVRPTYGGTPTGTVTFWLNSTTSLGTGTVVNGTAQATTTAVPAGSRSIYATYNGDTNFATGSSLPTQLTVAQATSATTAFVDVNPANYGQTVTLSATVQSTGGTPTGSVTFMDGTSTLGTVTLANAAAQLPVTNFGAGSHSITAKYSGDTNFSGSTSSALTETINQLATTTTLSSSLNPATVGQAVTLTATVQAGSGVSVAGTVTFLDGSTTLGTVTLASNSAQLTTSTLAQGAHTLTAVYAANTNFTGSTSAALSETVNQVATTTSLASSLNPAPAAQSVTFTAAIQAGAGNSASGTVTFLDGSVTLGAAAVSSNSAQFTTSNLAPGAHAITAVYSGSTTFAGSTSAVLTETVNLIATTTTLASSLNPALASQSVTLTATVQAGTGISTTGTVNFMDGSSTLGTATVSNNSAQLTVSTLAVGTHTITAVYGGSTDFGGSTSSPLTQTVNQSGTTTTLVSNLNPATFGQGVPFVATVQTASGGAATGTVTFYDGSTTLGTATVTNNGVQHNVALLTFAGFLGGSHTITAAYSGDANYAPSTSSALTETVNPASSSVTAAASPNPASYGQAVTLTATVVPSISGDLASGAVTFFDGSTSLGTANLSNNVAHISVTSFALGSHSITASYAGDRNFAGSTSAALTQSVTQSGSSTAVSSNANPSSYGQAVTFTATVAPAYSGTPTGTVSFFDGSTSLGNATLSSGVATFSTSATALIAGSHSISAKYNGDSNYLASSSAAFVQTINPAATVTTLASNANPSAVGKSVNFTAQVSSSVNGNLTGTVNFYLDGSTTPVASVSLSGGNAQYTTSSLSGGTHSLSAAFVSTNSNFNGSTSTPLTQAITDFSISASPASDTIARGSSGTYTLTLSPIGGLTGNVSLSCSGAPGSTTCSISPSQVTLDGTSSAQATVTVTVARNAGKGTHTLNLKGTSGSVTHSTTVSLTID